MDKKVLYLDFDSTIVNSEKSICDIYNNKYKDHNNFEKANWWEVRNWAFMYTCKLIHELSENPIQDVTDMFCTDEFFSNLAMYEGASEVIPKLCEKYDVVICTCATPLNASKKVLWIEEHMPYISEVITVIKNGNNGVGKGRVHMIEKNSIFIDDHPSNLLSTKAENKYLFKYKETDFNGDWTGNVFSSWDDIKKELL